MHLDPCPQSDGLGMLLRPESGPPAQTSPPSTRTTTGAGRSGPKFGGISVHPSRPAPLQNAIIHHDREGGEGDTGRTLAEGNKRCGAHPRRRSGALRPCGTPSTTCPGAPPEGTARPCVAARIRACDAVCGRRGTRAARVSSHASAPAAHGGVVAGLRLPRREPPTPGLQPVRLVVLPLATVAAVFVRGYIL